MSDNPMVASLREEFRDPESRHDYAALFFNSAIALQIKTLRLQRGWSQEELAERSGLKPRHVAALEDASRTSWSIETLRKLAVAFDLALVISFEGFGAFLDNIASASRGSLERPSFGADPAFHEEPRVTASKQSGQPARVRVFRHDIQQWAEVPENLIGWGPDTKAVTCRTELVHRFEPGTLSDRNYVPYFVPFWGDEWAVRISFAPDSRSKEDIDQSQVDLSRWLRGIADEWDRKQERASHERDSGNPIVTRAREIFLENVPGGEFTSVELRPHHEIAWCYGTRYGQAWKWPVYDAAYRWLTGMAEAVR